MGDPRGHTDQMLGLVLMGVGEIIGNEHDALTNPASGFLRAEAAGHFFGSVEATGLSLVAGPKSIFLGSPSVDAMLAEHVVGAKELLNIRGLTPGQIRASGLNGNLTKAFEGERIDTFFKELVTADPRLAGRVDVTPRFQFGPDVYSLENTKWWDLTTPGQWTDHLTLYKPLYGPMGTRLGY